MNKPSYKELEKRVAFLEQEIKTKLRQKDVLIQDINEGVAAKTGESFFETIVLKLSKALRSDYTFVGKLLPDENKVETISLCVDNSIVDNFSYDIKGTPCENVIGAKICTYAANVFSSFPDDLLLRDMEVEGYVGIPLFNSQNKPMGIMVALFKNEIEDTSYVEQIMEIFSSRTGAELERYATEEALRESEIIFKSIFHNSGIGIALVNMDGKIIKANRTVEKMYSDKIGKLTGKNFTDIVHHDDAEETKAQFMKIVSGEIDEIKAERKYVSKNGAVVFVNLNARVVKDYSGSPNFIVAFIEDITERKLAEEKLKQSEQKLAFHFEETPIGIIEWNSNFEVVSWNKAAENIFGYSKEEATGRHSIGLILPEKTWPEIENIWDSLSGKTGGIRNINENLTKEGKTILCDWYNTAMIDEQGNTIGMASMVIDITEQKQIEDQLKKLTTAVEQSANTVVITDLEGNIEYVNKKFTETSGYSYKEAIGQNPRILKTDFNTKETYKNLWDTITHGKSWAGEFLNRKKNGDQYWEKATITPVKNNNNEIVNYIAVKEDITEKRRALNELKESEEKFFKAYHNNPDSLHITSIPDGRFIEVNSVFERLSGYSKEELIGKTSTEMGFYVNLNDRERLFNQLSDKGKLVDYEIIFRMKSGKQRICRLFSEIIEIKGKPQLLSIVRDITEQKQIEDQLKKLTTAVEQSANTVVITDLEGNIEYVNKKFTEITGYTYEEAIGQNPRILKTDYHKNKIYQKLWNTITNGKTWRGEFLNKKKNGDLYWEKGTITPVKNDQGDIINYIAIKEDITELKRSQEELIQASEIWQNIQTGLYIYHMEDLNDDASLRMIAANPASEILTGIRTRDVIGKTLDENFPGLREKGIPQKYAEVVRTKNNIRFEDLVYGDDRVIQGAFSVEAFSLPENKVGVSFENISERKQAEGKLRKSEQKLSIHIEETPVGVIEWNIDFEVTSWNKAAENIFGYSKEEAIGSYTVGLIVPESAREKIDVVWDALINQTGGKRSINENITKEGKTILCDWYNTALVDEEGNTIGVASIVQDITIQKRIEKDLKDSEEKHKLISKISSDYVYSIQPDRNGKYMIKWVSGAFKRITGYTVEEINSMDNQLKSIIHPEDLKRLDQKHINLSKLKLSATDEYRIITKSGRVKWLSDSYVQLHGPESKKIQMIHGSVKDITYKKLSEEVLKDSEHLLRESQKVAKMGSYVMDITSGIWQSSAILNKMFGIGKRYNTDVSGWLQIVHPEDRAMMQDYFVTNVLKNKEPFNKEYRIKRINDQQEYWMHGMGKLEFDDDGNPIKMIGTIQDITDRKQAEEELGKQHYYLEKAEEIGKTGTWELDLIENKLFWSNQNYSIFGIPIGTPLTYELFVDCVHPDDREYVNAQWLASLDGKPYDIEHRLLIDGEVKWVSEKAELIFDENNKALRAIGFTQDITERKQTQARLINSEKRFRQITENAQEWIWEVDSNGLYTFSSQIMEKMFGYKNEEIVGKKHFYDFFLPKDREELKNAAFNVFKQKQPFDEFLNRNLTKDGEIIWLSTSGVPILDSDGNLLGYRGRDINITKRKLAEEAMWISEKKFSKIFELNPEITWIVKEEGRVIVDVNHTLTDILGYSKEEIVGKTAVELDIWQNLEDREKLFEEYEINKGFARVESKLKTKNGQILNVDILARRIEFDDTFHLMAIIRDITELRKSEERIKKNNEEMITLNKQIAEYKMMALRSVMNPHFIFNCLNSIQFFILKNEKKSAIDYLSLFSKLIRNVLNSSVNRYTTLEIEVETLKYYVELEKLRFDDKFQFILSLDDNIEADEIEIPSLIIQPYIENAIIHGLTNKEGQGTLRLEIKELNDKLLCIIEDDGIGRKKSESLKIHRSKHHKSVGMTVTEERLDIINRTNYVSVNIIDLEVNGMANGTRVELLINIEKR